MDQGGTDMTDAADSTPGRISARRTGRGLVNDPGAMAPSVEKAWRDELITELRLLDVPGERIGDALMTVETHVRESGESAEEAFGEARAYARELAGREPARRWQVSAGMVLGAAAPGQPPSGPDGRVVSALVIPALTVVALLVSAIPHLFA